MMNYFICKKIKINKLVLLYKLTIIKIFLMFLILFKKFSKIPEITKKNTI